MSNSTYTAEQLQGIIDSASGFVTGAEQRFALITERSASHWPAYYAEAASPYRANPSDATAQALINLAFKIGNLNLQFDALLLAMDSQGTMS